MKFNELKRGHKRQANTEEKLYEILDQGFVCTLAVSIDQVPMMIPTAYGRKGDTLYIHGSQKNHLLNAAVEAEQVCISVHHTDGIVLAQTLFNTSINYRSVILFGKAEKIDNETEHLEALHIITHNIIPGRWEEVKTGTPEQLKATQTLKIKILSASVKIREVGPEGDEDLNEAVWSGVLPLRTVALPPEYDPKRLEYFKEDESVQYYYLKHKS